MALIMSRALAGSDCRFFPKDKEVRSHTVTNFLRKAVSSLAPCGLILLTFAGTAMATKPEAPEIDPSLLGSGLALLAGGVLVVMERYRRNRRDR
jgi:hypothetical protein